MNRAVKFIESFNENFLSGLFKKKDTDSGYTRPNSWGNLRSGQKITDIMTVKVGDTILRHSQDYGKSIVKILKVDTAKKAVYGSYVDPHNPSKLLHANSQPFPIFKGEEKEDDYFKTA